MFHGANQIEPTSRSHISNVEVFFFRPFVPKDLPPSGLPGPNCFSDRKIGFRKWGRKTAVRWSTARALADAWSFPKKKKPSPSRSLCWIQVGAPSAEGGALKLASARCSIGPNFLKRDVGRSKNGCIVQWSNAVSFFCSVWEFLVETKKDFGGPLFSFFSFWDGRGSQKGHFRSQPFTILGDSSLPAVSQDMGLLVPPLAQGRRASGSS